ncbi:MAG TPA: methyltransferase [Bosea sp. (in: a-proteobacteria)]|nr:methyltransferase [Bosea sp. (in: a-proteobacteria)]
MYSASSGDERLDRRYAWAEAALKDGDPQAAIDILDQTLAENYGFTAAWHLYGLAQETLGHNEEAATAWRQCLDLDPNDHVGAKLDLARIGAMPAEQATSENFSGALFDGYAERFDSHLVGTLQYQAPALLRDALARHCEQTGRPFKFGTVLDLGCGTGLMGEVIRAETEFLVGCDLSPRMIAKALAKMQEGGRPLYDKLATAGLTAFLASRPDASADLVIAADVFVYLGDLAPCFHQSARVLKAGGLFAFTVQSHEGEGIAVGQDRRFAHAESWIREKLDEAKLNPALVEPRSTRIDRGQPVPGLIVVAECR